MHERGNIDHFPRQFIVSREGEHSLGQCCPPLRTLSSIFEQRYAFRVIWQAFAQQFEAAKDCHQQVVEVVCNAAGELADRL